MAKNGMSRAGAIFLSLLVLIVFVLLTIGELWAAKQLGMDVIAHLQVSKTEGGSKFFFEAFGFVAFILVQPVILVWLLLKMVRDFAAPLINSLGMWFR